MSQAIGLQFENVRGSSKMVEYLNTRLEFCRQVRSSAITAKNLRMMDQMNEEIKILNSLMQIVLDSK